MYLNIKKQNKIKPNDPNQQNQINLDINSLVKVNIFQILINVSKANMNEHFFLNK